MGFFGIISKANAEITTKGIKALNATNPTSLNAPKLSGQLTDDIFEKTCGFIHPIETLRDMSVGEVAKSFKNLTTGLLDWTTSLPKDGEAGCEVLKKTLQPYKELFETNWKHKPNNVQGFFRGVFGTNHMQTIEESRKINTFFNEFITSAENVVGKSFKDFFTA